MLNVPLTYDPENVLDKHIGRRVRHKVTNPFYVWTRSATSAANAFVTSASTVIVSVDECMIPTSNAAGGAA